ncbi:MAG: hypothetical protein RLP44_23630 [Aggregatilineales bacterium]
MRRLNFELGQTLFLYIFFSIFIGGPCSIFSPILAIHSTGLKQVFALVFAFSPFILGILFFGYHMIAQRYHPFIPTVIGVIASPILLFSVAMLYGSIIDTRLIIAGEMENYASGAAFLGVDVGVWLAGISGGVIVLCAVYYFRWQTFSTNAETGESA